jgi:hypothetical protein
MPPVFRGDPYPLFGHFLQADDHTLAILFTRYEARLFSDIRKIELLRRSWNSRNGMPGNGTTVLAKVFYAFSLKCSAFALTWKFDRSSHSMPFPTLSLCLSL